MEVHHLHYFGQGFRRTWIVRAAAASQEKTIAHEFGLAVIDQAVPSQSLQVSRAGKCPALVRGVQQGESNAPRSWAAVVADSGAGRLQPPTMHRREGGMGAAAASHVASPASAPKAEPIQKPAASTSPTPAVPRNSDLIQVMASATGAAPPAMRDQLQAMILAMQRTIKS